MYGDSSAEPRETRTIRARATTYSKTRGGKKKEGGHGRREQASSPEEEDQGAEAVSGAGAAENSNSRLDRFGNVIEVGDSVEFLIPGRCVGKILTVYRLTDKRVLCERNNGLFKSHREYRNVKKLG